MQASNIPAKFQTPFGNAAGAGYIRAIPATQPTPGNGQASLATGFPPETFTPPDAGGYAPDGRDFNGLLEQITAWNQWQAAGGPLKWDSAFSTAIGGYPQGAVVASATTLGLFWLCLVDNNTTNPDTGGANWAQYAQGAGTGSVSGLVIKNNSGTPNTQVDVTASKVAMVNSSGNPVVGTASLTINAATNGANGLDTGSLTTDTWYNVFLISNGTTVSGLLSLSATAPTMPSGYIYAYRVGAALTDGSSHFMRTIQRGNRAQYTVVGGSNTASLPVLAIGAAGSTSVPTYVAVAVGGFVPPTASSIIFTNFGGANSEHIIVAPNSSYGAETSTTNPPPFRQTNGAGVGENGAIGSLVLEGSNIYWANTGNAGDMIQCVGWEDNL